MTSDTPPDGQTTNREGWVFFVPTEAEGEGLARARSYLPKALEALRSYEENGVMDRHRLRLRAARASYDAQLDATVEGMAEFYAKRLACQVRDIRNRIAPANPQREDYHAVEVIVRMCALFAETVGCTGWDRVVYYMESFFLGKRVSFEGGGPDLLQQALRAMVERFQGLPDHEVLCEFMRALADEPGDGLTLMAVCLPTAVSPQDIEDDPEWVEHTATAGSITATYEKAVERMMGLRSVDRSLNDTGDRFSKSIAWLMGLEMEAVDQDSGAKLTSVWDFLRFAHLEQRLEQALRRRNFLLGTVFLKHTGVYLSSPLVWQFFLARFGLAPEALVGGLVELVERPRRLARWQARPELGEFRHQLKQIASAALGPVRDTVQFRHLQEVLARKPVDPAEAVLLTAQFLAFSSAYQRNDPKLISVLVEVLHDALPAFPIVLERSRCEFSALSLRTPDDIEWQRLLELDAKAQQDARQELERWIEENGPKPEAVSEATPVAQEAPNTVEFQYVFNIGSPAGWRTELFQCQEPAFAESLESFLRDHRIEIVVPAQSVARALAQYFFELSDAQRRDLAAGEEIASVWWRKLKRGRQRIYLLERDGQFFVHLLKRKEWTHSSELTRRF